MVDTNIILDFLLEREPFLHDADALFQEIASGQLIGYAIATTPTDIFYIAIGSGFIYKPANAATKDSRLISSERASPAPAW